MSDHWDANEAATRAFSAPEHGENYLDRILTCLRDASAGLRRLLVLLVFSMALFELLNRAAVGKVTFEAIEIEDPKSVATFIPVIVAYLQYRLVRQVLYWRSLEITFVAVIAVVEPGVAENKLARYLVPTVPLFSNPQPKGAPFEKVLSLQERAEAFVGALCALALPAFQVYALNQIFADMGGRPSTAFLIAVCMTAILTIAYLIAITMLVSSVIHWWLEETFIKKHPRVHQWLLALRRRILSDRSG